MAIVVKKTNNAPMIYGASVTDASIGFGIGTLDKVLAKIGSTDDNNIYFGYTNDSSQAAIVARGKLVSSKIVDASYVAEVLPKAAVLYTYDEYKALDGNSAVTEEEFAALTDALKTKTAAVAGVAPSLSLSYIDVASKSVQSMNVHLPSDADVLDVSNRVYKIETIMGDAENPDGNTVVDKVVEIIDWFNNLPEDASVATQVLADVSTNTAHIGTNGGDSAHSSGLYKMIYDVSNAVDNLDSSVTIATKAADGKVTLLQKVVETDGKIETGDSSITFASVATTGSANDVSVAALSKSQANSSVAITIADGSTVNDAIATLADVIMTDASAIGRPDTADSSATGLYKLIYDVSSTINGQDVPSTTTDGSNIHVTYSEDNGVVSIDSIKEDYATVTRTITNSTVDTPTTDASITVVNDGSLVTGADLMKVAGFAKDSAQQVKDAIDASILAMDSSVDVTDASSFVQVVIYQEDGKLVDSSSSVSVTTKTLADAVGMTYDEDTKTWSSADGTVTTDGLTTASDVAKEIVDDEKVIAAALNDHETRLNNIETGALDISANITDTKADYSKTITVSENASTNTSIGNLSTSITDATTTYQLHVQAGDLAAKDVTETITVINSSVIDQLLQIIQNERERAALAEAALDASVKDHENRLTWIEL